MACDCISVMDGELATRNTKLVCGIVFSRPEAYAVPAIEVEKLNKRHRDRVSVVPTFCPFCGVRYVAQPPAITEADAGTEGRADG